jgi:uncharacterized DUF497 family protein
MRIAFDPDKRTITLAERGLDMARAGEIFEGETLTFPDDRVDYGELRYITVGFLDGRMVVAVWTQRTQTRRMISLRKANEREQKFYGSRLES